MLEELGMDENWPLNSIKNERMNDSWKNVLLALSSLKKLTCVLFGDHSVDLEVKTFYRLEENML